MEREKPIDFNTEKVKRRYLPEFIREFLNEIRRADFDGDDVALAKHHINEARQAIEDLKNGDPTKAKEVIDFDIQRIEGWMKLFTDPSRDIERRSEFEKKIERLRTLRDQL